MRYPLSRLVSILILTMAASGSFGEAKSSDNPLRKADYAGDTVCRVCHAASFESFGKTRLGKVLLNHPPKENEGKACESCHGPGQAHVDARGGLGTGGLVTFRKDAGESTETKNAPCIVCHTSGNQAHWPASAHSGRGVACVDCHTMMKETTDRFQLAAKASDSLMGGVQASTRLCLSCHVKIKAKTLRSAHMPLREGKMACTDCHNPHGTANPGMLDQASVNDNCYACHADKRGPFLWEHPPVMENCNTCHDPHGSVNDKMLNVRLPRLCQACHAAPRHPSTPAGTNESFVYNRSCLNCHSQIHGSNHPSGLRLLR